MNSSIVRKSLSLFLTLLTLPLLGVANAQATDSQMAKDNLDKLQQTKTCKGCNLAGANLNRLELPDADLEGADLSGAKVTLCNLSRANLRNANLRGTIFGGSDLSDADFRGADLRGASLDSSYHQGALFDGEFVAARPYADVGAPDVEKEVYVADTATPKKAPEPANVEIEGEKTERKPDARTAQEGKPSTASSAPEEKKVSAAMTGNTAPPVKKVAPISQAMVDESPVEPEKKPAPEKQVENPELQKPAAEKSEAKAEKAEAKAVSVSEPSAEKPKDHTAKKFETTQEAEPAKRLPQAPAKVVTASEEAVAPARPMPDRESEKKVVASDEKGKEKESVKSSPQPPPTATVIAEKKEEAKSQTIKKTDESVKEKGRETSENDKLASLLDSRKCYGCKLTDCNLAGKNLGKADLEKADLSGCNLEGVDLDGANLKGASLRNVNLKGATLENVDFYKADLTGADLTGAKVKGAMFDAAKVEDAVGLKEAQLNAVK